MEIRRPPEWGPDPIPKEKKILRFIDIFVLWFSLGVGLLVMLTGAILVMPSELGGFGLSFGEAAIIIVVGSIFGSFLLALVGVIGSKYGVPTMVSIRPILGKKGSYIPTILNIVQLVGWTAFEFWVMSITLTYLSGNFLGDFTRYFWIIVVAIWCLMLAIGGPLVVVRDYLEKFAVWLVILFSVILTVLLLVTPDFSSRIFGHAGENLGLYLLALDMVVVMPISWMPLISDYNRFAKDEKAGLYGTWLSYTIANAWFYILGAMLFLVGTQTNNSIISLIASIQLVLGGFASLAILFIILDETDNAFADIYSTAVSMQNIEKKIPQYITALITTIISVILAASLDLASYEIFLLFIGATFVPLFGVIIADYYFVRKGEYNIDEFYGASPEYNVESIIAWIIGMIVYYLLAPWLTGLPDITHLSFIGSTIPSLLTAAVIKVLLARLKK